VTPFGYWNGRCTRSALSRLCRIPTWGPPLKARTLDAPHRELARHRHRGPAGRDGQPTLPSPADMHPSAWRGSWLSAECVRESPGDICFHRPPPAPVIPGRSPKGCRSRHPSRTLGCSEAPDSTEFPLRMDRIERGSARRTRMYPSCRSRNNTGRGPYRQCRSAHTEVDSQRPPGS